MYPDFAASRAYYAAFYAATAALLDRGLAFSTHRSVLSTFHREFVGAGVVEIELGKGLNRLYELRDVGDYGETQHVTVAGARAAVQLTATSFLKAIHKVLDRP